MNKTEARIQQEIVKWFRNSFCLKHHNPRSMILSIPNNRLPGMKETGQLTGASDLLVIYRKLVAGQVVENRQIWVEIKTPTGRQQPEQKKFQEHVEQMDGEYVVIRSLLEFITLITS